MTLVVDPKANAVVCENYRGPVRLSHNDFAARLLREMPERRDAIQAGSTVAHVNFYLAKHLGCDPIVLIGQDLAFGENLYYAPGNAIHTVWSSELNRFNTLEMMEWQRIARLRKSLRLVPGQGGRPIFTDAQMFTYIQQFERDFAMRRDITVINATEGGADLEGTREMPLAKVIAQYCDALPELRLDPPKPRPDAAERLAEGAGCLRTGWRSWTGWTRYLPQGAGAAAGDADLPGRSAAVQPAARADEQVAAED